MRADQFHPQAGDGGDQHLRLANMVPQAGLAFRPVIEAPFAIRALLIGGISILAGGKAAPDFRILQLGTQVQRGLDQEPDPLAAGKWIIGIAIELTQRLARVVRRFGQCLGGAGDGGHDIGHVQRGRPLLQQRQIRRGFGDAQDVRVHLRDLFADERQPRRILAARRDRVVHVLDVPAGDLELRHGRIIPGCGRPVGAAGRATHGMSVAVRWSAGKSGYALRSRPQSPERAARHRATGVAGWRLRPNRR